MSEQSTEITRQLAARRRSVDTAEPTKHAGAEVHPLLRLQSQVGNGQIARLLAQRAEEDELAAKHDLAQRAEEDELAAKHDFAQRAEEDELAAKHDETVGVEGGPVGPNTAEQISSMRGNGSPLDDQTRTSMEGAMGTNFSDVRVHADHASDTLNRRLTARAFTTGSDIFLRSDASATDTRLMAHELTHVVQQRSSSGGGSGMTVGAAGDAQEHHADAVADAVSVSAPVQAPVAQRAEEDELAAKHDLAQRAEEDELAASHDLAQRAEEDELAAKHDLAQRAEEDELAAKHDLAQRHGADGEQLA